MKARRSFFRVVLSVVLLTGGIADLRSQILPFHRFTTADGLPSNHVTTLLQDSEGFLWIGTSDGLARYTGTVFETYTPRNGLPDPVVTDIAEDRNSPGAVWIGTMNGLYRFDGANWSTVYRVPGRTDCTINALYQDHTGRLWFVVNDTVQALDRGLVTTLRVPQPCLGIGQILETGDSLVWFSHAEGLIRFCERTGTFSAVERGRFAYHGRRPMCVDGKGELWVHRRSQDRATSTFLHFCGTRLIERRTMPAVGESAFLVADRRGSLFANAPSGIARMELSSHPGTFSPFCSEENGLPENDLRSGLIDREGNLWVGGNARGLAELSDWSIVRIPLSGAEDGHRESVAVADSEGHLWVIAHDGLHEIYRDTVWHWHNSLHILQHHPVSIALDRHKHLWLAFQDARLCRLRPVPTREGRSSLDITLQLLPGKDFPAGFPITLMVDSEGSLWYSLGGVGLVHVRPRARGWQVEVLGVQNHIPVNYVRVLLEDSRHRIWCGSYDEGLYLLPTAGTRRAIRVNSGSVTSIRGLFEDRAGRIWFGSEMEGLGILDGAHVRNVTARDGLRSNIVRAVTQDNKGRIWLGTGYGAVRIDSLSPLTLYVKDDLSAAPVFAAGRFRSGLLWFLTVEGVIIYDPEHDEQTVPPPPVQITGLYVNGARIPFNPIGVLPYQQTTCTIEFVSPSYLEAHAIHYWYRMEPEEQRWQGPVAEPRITYSALPPGRHRFLVTAVNAWGVPSVAPTNLVISVDLPFWERGWFLFAAWMGTGLLLAAFVRRYELGKLRRRMAILENERALEKERLRIAQDMHDEIGSTLTEISILGELGRKSAGSSPQVSQTMETMAAKSRDVLDSITEIIWAINPRNDELDNLAAYVRRFTLRFCERSGLQCSIGIPDDLPTTRLATEQRRNIFLIVKESLNNVVKHARASRVSVHFAFEGEVLTVKVADDGRGFDPASLQPIGTGLSSMQNRAQDIGGSLHLASSPGRGTTVRLYLKCGIVGRPQIR
jgi:signal transduction histidine kinase/ligand-binding sensor domain-containing protein